MKPISTFSIVGRDPETGELGIAVQSKFLAVGSAVAWAKSGAGAIATQALANLDYGEIGLKLLEKGYSAEKTLAALLAMDDGREDRQIGIVDNSGNSVTYTGSGCFDWAGGICGENFACQGNILVSEATVAAMAETFRNTGGSLARRLVKALDKAQDAGGDKRGRQSAALLVVKEKGSYGGFNDRYIDLRVDDDPEPIKRLINLLELHELYFNKTQEGEILQLNEENIKRLQQALKKLGYYTGEADGIYDAAAKASYINFCRMENFEERLSDEDTVDLRVFEFMQKKAE